MESDEHVDEEDQTNKHQELLKQYKDASNQEIQNRGSIIEMYRRELDRNKDLLRDHKVELERLTRYFHERKPTHLMGGLSGKNDESSEDKYYRFVKDHMKQRKESVETEERRRVELEELEKKLSNKQAEVELLSAEKETILKQQKDNVEREVEDAEEDLEKEVDTAKEKEEELQHTVKEQERIREEKEIEGLRRLRTKSKIKKIAFKSVETTKKLGKGRSGFTIYKGRWKDNDVLFRVFDVAVFKTSRFNIFQFFEKELREYSTFDHPNVLRYFAYSKPPKVGVATEFCHNATLQIFLSRKKGKIPSEKKLDMASEIANGMDYVHKEGIIHRDLRAQNVFLTKEFKPKIDFGFNRTFNKKFEHSRYAAPELIVQDDECKHEMDIEDEDLPVYEKIAVKCDVFSFGILMYELAVESFDPYELGKGCDEMEIGVKVANDPNYRPPYEDRIGDFPNWYINLMKRCWEHSPVKRPSFQQIKGIITSVRVIDEEEDGGGDESDGETSDSDDSS